MSLQHKETLYLIPAPLGEGGLNAVGEYFKPTVFSLNHFIVEDEKTARRYLKALGYPHSLNDLKLFLLNEHTKNNPEELLELLSPLKNGISMGLLSDAGCPAVADPGAAVVSLCHETGIKVVPFVGPSSIMLALMASGMNGQNFAFVGYLPVKDFERKKEIQRLELLSAKSYQTQIFIETPYRNNQLLKDLLAVCKPETKICIAADLTLPSELIRTRTVRQWKTMLPDLNKRPAVFLMLG
jgi:16S rRNA (cytidine1402-2'-O)-methyltransferase